MNFNALVGYVNKYKTVFSIEKSNGDILILFAILFWKLAL